LSEVEKIRLAEAHFARAREALAKGDETAAVLWSNLCAEVAMECIARQNDMDLRKDHFLRASAARRLFEAGILDEDLTSLLIRLNNERKHAVYEARSPDLKGRTWEQVMEHLGRLVAVASQAAQASEPDTPG
jgi:HEPN domain-containing protein